MGGAHDNPPVLIAEPVGVAGQYDPNWYEVYGPQNVLVIPSKTPLKPRGPIQPTTKGIIRYFDLDQPCSNFGVSPGCCQCFIHDATTGFSVPIPDPTHCDNIEGVPICGGQVDFDGSVTGAPGTVYLDVSGYGNADIPDWALQGRTVNFDHYGVFCCDYVELSISLTPVDGSNGNNNFCASPCILTPSGGGEICMCDPPIPSPIPRAYRSAATKLGLWSQRSNLLVVPSVTTARGGTTPDTSARAKMLAALNPSLRVPTPFHFEACGACTPDEFEELVSE